MSADPSAAPDIEGLKMFARATDRAAPAAFVGRPEEIGTISERVRDCVESWRGGDLDAWKGRTTLIQGAPGAGKTALLDHLAGVLPGKIGGLQVCWIGPKEAGHPDDWRPKLAGALFEGAGERLRKARSVEGEIDAKVAKGRDGTTGPLLTWSDVTGAAATADKAAPAPRAASPPSPENIGFLPQGEEKAKSGALAGLKDAGSNIAGEAADAFAGLGPARPVLLIIDEVQQVSKNDETIRLLSETLHDATDKLPIFPVYGGLAWSDSRLDDLGISRKSLGYVSLLEPLTSDECREAVRKFFKKFRVRGAARARPRLVKGLGCGGGAPRRRPLARVHNV